MARKEIEFTALEQYREQASKGREKSQKLHDRAEQAAEVLTKLKHEYEELVRQSLDVTGDEEAEVLAQVDKLGEEIEKQQAVYTRRKAETVAYGRIQERTISRKDVQEAFRNEFKPQYQAERVQPILDHVAELKAQLVASMQELEQAEREYESYKSEMWSEVGQDVQFDIWGSVTIGAASYLITTETLHSLDLSQLPQGVNVEQVEAARKALQQKLGKGRK
jgi:hypothetical protein